MCADGGTWLEKNEGQYYDFIFADAWPGKFSYLELVLDMLPIGGIYVIDDLLPQDNWPEGHAPGVLALTQEIESQPNLVSVRMAWASGLMLVTKAY